MIIYLILKYICVLIFIELYENELSLKEKKRTHGDIHSTILARISVQFEIILFPAYSNEKLVVFELIEFKINIT